MRIEKNNLILADCEIDELCEFIAGYQEATDEKLVPRLCLARGHGGIIQNLRRYATYFSFPLKSLSHRDSYGVIIGWQQFYAINFAFFCRLFGMKKRNKVVALNFTYKRKSGVVGWVFHHYMKFSCRNQHLDYFHVPSHNYVALCCKELGLKPEQFIVTGFGVPDTYEEMKHLTVDYPEAGQYAFAIGRSNRDFDFLVEVWKQECLKDCNLVIASDTWRPKSALPDNITFRNDIQYEESFAWLNNCTINVIPIDDANICSGDTVLLTAMMFGKPVVVTAPSTLSEMYVEDGINGLCVAKDATEAASKIAALLRDEGTMQRLGKTVRERFVAHFSRRSMGISVGKWLNPNHIAD